MNGTNIETNADGWQPAQSCPKQQCEEPFVHTSGGVPVNQFAISFVNHAQLRRGIPSPDAISAAHHSLAADHAEDHMENRAEADAEDHVQDHAEADAEDHMQDHAEGDAEDHMQDHAEADAKDPHAGPHGGRRRGPYGGPRGGRCRGAFRRPRRRRRGHCIEKTSKCFIQYGWGQERPVLREGCCVVVDAMPTCSQPDSTT